MLWSKDHRREGGRHGITAPGPRRSRTDRPSLRTHRPRRLRCRRAGGRAASQRATDRGPPRPTTCPGAVTGLNPFPRPTAAPGLRAPSIDGTLIACVTGDAAPWPDQPGLSIRYKFRGGAAGVWGGAGDRWAPAVSDGLIAGIHDNLVEVFDPVSSTAVTVSDTDTAYSTVAFSGSLVVWDDRRNGNSDIYARRFDRETGQPAGDVFAICTAPGAPEGPSRRRRHRRLAGRARRRLGHLCLRPERTARIRRLHGARRPDPARRVRRRPSSGRTVAVASGTSTPATSRAWRRPRSALPARRRCARPCRATSSSGRTTGRGTCRSTTSPPGATTARWCTPTAAPRARLWRRSGAGTRAPARRIRT